MYELTIQTEFCAAHAIVIGGVREPLHGHNFHVTACVSALDLDSEGLAVDFHAVERTLRHLLKPWDNQNLNEVEPFTTLNPTAELIAKVIADRLALSLRQHGVLDGLRVRVAWVRVTEAPGCAATYIPRKSSQE